jgi:hypothetical protein
MAADPARVRVGKRKHGQLDDGGPIDEAIEYPELERVDHVLGVVKHDRFRAAPAVVLVGDERVIEVRHYVANAFAT